MADRWMLEAPRDAQGLVGKGKARFGALAKAAFGKRKLAHAAKRPKLGETLKEDGMDTARDEIGEDGSLLIVDDDAQLAKSLARAMEKRGFAPSVAMSVTEGVSKASSEPPAYAIVDLRLEDGNGLEVVRHIRKVRKDCRMVVLTGYGAFSTAVAAGKIGAVDYMAKPADADAIKSALVNSGRGTPPPAEREISMSLSRIRWEHIQRVHELCGRNVSETARRLGLHRRTLQRILEKRPRG